MVELAVTSFADQRHQPMRALLHLSINGVAFSFAIPKKILRRAAEALLRASVQLMEVADDCDRYDEGSL